MQTREWTTIDKSSWGPGPWQSEPDKIQYQDEDTGLPCLIHRNSMGALCGYVGVSKDHPLFGIEEYPDLSCHGGITFIGFCQPHSEDGSTGICHVPELSEPDEVFWLGFDCAHCFDFSPAYRSLLGPKIEILLGGGTYRTIDYVKDEIRSLANRLKAME